jgi:2-oxoisovalerate dehydrogenase E2 component (dihydrolipoyl transacylase)
MPAFLLPDLGEGLTEAEIVAWHVQAGDTVTVDQAIVEVETAKAVVEVPVPFAGRVTGLHGKPGDVVSVGEPLVTVDTADRTVSSPVPAPGRGTAEQQAVGPGQETGFTEPGVVTSPAAPGDAGESGNVLIGYGTSGGRRRRRRAARPSSVTPAPEPPAASTAATGAPTGSTVPSPASNGHVAVASPLIRQLARNAGVDITAIRGSGRGGLITRQDVDTAINARLAEPASGPEAAPAVQHATESAQSAEVTRIPIRGLRKTVADKLTRSRREIPEATVWVDVDATELLSLRKTLNADPSAPKISILALLSRFTILALRRYPELNARIEGDEIVLSPPVHLGFAAQTDRGLVVPVVPDAQAHTLEQLSTAFAERTLRAREGKLGPAELTGGTFTVNNYGVFGVDGSAAIINHPEVAILGIGRIIQRPWVIDGQIVPRQMTELTLAFDHRVCDGGAAGGFLRFIADCVESPVNALRHL